jgi:predicted ATPase/transcriptional regulator with XRE-family HTH domain
MLPQVSFGEWLKRQRKVRGMTQEQFARQIGCATITLRKIEAEERRPSIQIVERLASILDVPASEWERFLRYARGELKYALADLAKEAPWQATASTPTNLPVSLTTLIGREAELAGIQTYLWRVEIRLVTLIGPPGIGKTQLGIEAAHQLLAEFSDGIFFVALAPLDDSSLIALTTLQALNYVESKKLPVEKQLVRGIGEKHMLIVLDNCEHLVQAAATFAAGLLLACPRLKILATSREALRISGEWLFTVSSLNLPRDDSSIDMNSASQYSALTLFTERARAVQTDFALTSNNIKTVSAICAQLDGLPLAIELVAAQMRLFSPKSLLERLSDQLIFSAKGARTASSRQLSLSHAIGWSYELLTPDERKLFAYLSIFSGGFTLLTAEAIFSKYFSDESVSNLIVSLLDKSLLQRALDSQGETRFRMLVTIQHFALERLRNFGEEAEVRDAHLDYFLDLAERVDQEIHGPNQLEWSNRAEIELDNFRASFHWALQTHNAEAGLRLTNRLNFWRIIRGYQRDGISWLESVLTLGHEVSIPSKAAALSNLGGMISMSKEGYSRRVSNLLHESLLLFQKLENEAGVARALNLLGLFALEKGEYEKAEQFFGKSLALRRPLGDPWSIANTLQNFIGLNLIQGNLADAKKFAEETLALFHEAGDLRGIARELVSLGEIAHLEGNIKDATVMLTQAISQLWQIRDQWSLALALENLAMLQYVQGDPGRSARLFGIAEAIRNVIGTPIEAYDLAIFEKYGEPSAKTLQEMAHTEAWAEGRAMAMEQAIAYALEEQSS